MSTCELMDDLVCVCVCARARATQSRQVAFTRSRLQGQPVDTNHCEDTWIGKTSTCRPCGSARASISVLSCLMASFALSPASDRPCTALTTSPGRTCPFACGKPCMNGESVTSSIRTVYAKRYLFDALPCGVNRRHNHRLIHLGSACHRCGNDVSECVCVCVCSCVYVWTV